MRPTPRPPASAYVLSPVYSVTNVQTLKVPASIPASRYCCYGFYAIDYSLYTVGWCLYTVGYGLYFAYCGRYMFIIVATS